MSAAAPLLKQIACLRRRADMTRKEFFDHHFCVHGSISDIPESIDEKPHKYLQTHFFDAAFGGRTDGIAGTGNHSWVGRDDMTELYFRDWDHMKSCFSSDYVRTTIAPDGENFNDLETAIPLLVIEKPLSLDHSMLSSEASEGSRTVAVLFLATKSNKSEEELERVLSPALVESLSEHARGEIYGLQVNVGIPADQFDIRAYFGGKNMPEYPVAYKIYMKGSESVAAVRKAQKAFTSRMADVVDSNQTFITFGQEGLVMDVGNKIRFDKSRQPQLPPF